MNLFPRKLVFAIMILCGVALTIAVGCSDSLIRSSNSTGLRFAIDTNDSFHKPTAVEFFAVFVTDPEQGDTLAAASLVLNGAFLEGEIDSIPAGMPLTFTVQARENVGELPTPGRVIYEGSVTTTLLAGQLNEINVSMRPIVPMMKISQRYFDFTDQLVEADSAFTFDVRVFNVDSLHETSFRLYFDESFCTIDSAVLAPQLLADSLLLFQGYEDLSFPVYGITVAQGRTLTPIVDDNGDGILVRFFFRTTTSGFASSSFSYISLQLLSMAKSNPDNIIDIYTVEVDYSLLEFTAVPQ